MISEYKVSKNNYASRASSLKHAVGPSVHLTRLSLSLLYRSYGMWPGSASTSFLESECFSSWAWRLKAFRSLSTLTHSIVNTARQQRNKVLIRYSYCVQVMPLKACTVLDSTFSSVQTQHSNRLLLTMARIPP